MSRIKLLPDNLINRIAAGEVVERPASILKELVENSLDAGADQIEIDILSGGKKLIRVRDNGCGLDEDDLYMCLERHATSKIDQNSDLMSIGTLGFRGEALPSIASVSRLTITSLTPGGQGHAIKIAGGRLSERGPAAANPGAVIEVADLFFNVPARRKFLKSDQTESAHLLDVAQRYALSRKGLRLIFREGARVLLSVDGLHDFKTRAMRVMGRETAESLTPFELERNGLRLSGWLGPAERAGRSSSGLFLYVLGRPVRDRLLLRALAQGYGRQLPPGRWPAAIVMVELDPRDVDVNVHPAKAEVRFRRPEAVFSALAEAVAQSVGRGLARPTAFQTEGRLRPAAPEEERQAPWLYQAVDGTGVDASAPRAGGRQPEAPPTFWPPENGASPDRSPGPAAEPAPPWMLEAARPENAAPPWLAAMAEAAGGPDAAHAAPQLGANAALAGKEPMLGDSVWPLAQFQQSYILAQGPAGLYIVDQHAAHERVLYNQLKTALAKDGLPGQKRLFPDSCELPPHQALAAEKLAPHLARLGFELEHFGGQTYVLKGAPAILGDRDPWPPLLEILGAGQSRLAALEGAGLKEALEELSGSWLYSLACRAAVKAGRKLSHEEMAKLLNDLAQAQSGAFCPHGRPSVFVLSRGDLDKKFNR